MIIGFDMTNMMGGSVVDIVSTDNAFVALLDDFLSGVSTRKGNAKGDNSKLWVWPKDSWGVMLLMLRGILIDYG